MCLFTVDELSTQILGLRHAAHFDDDAVILDAPPNRQPDELEDAVHQVTTRGAACAAILQLHGICHIDALVLLGHFGCSLPVVWL